ncbi:MAG: twin-arginine translocase subunit TatC [Alphaproteobacteria bacterium]|nr:twin-arginine translocase subunit TatC [Alphaproteobacteria bacterium]
MSSSTKAPLMVHLIELRDRMIRVFAVWGLTTALCYFYAGHIYNFLVEPLATAFAGDENRRLIYTSLTETFVTYIRLAIYGGFFIGFPYIATQIYLFIAPGLYKREKAVILPYLVGAPILFLLGAALAYYFVMPVAWGFFLSFELPRGEAAIPLMLEAKVSEYVTLVVHVTVAFGLAFQLPVLLTLLVRMGMMKTDTLVNGRRFAVVILLVIAAILTPPDVLSQLMLFIPLYVLYECSIVVCRAIEKRREVELEHA